MDEMCKFFPSLKRRGKKLTLAARGRSASDTCARIFTIRRQTQRTDKARVRRHRKCVHRCLTQNYPLLPRAAKAVASFPFATSLENPSVCPAAVFDLPAFGAA